MYIQHQTRHGHAIMPSKTFSFSQPQLITVHYTDAVAEYQLYLVSSSHTKWSRNINQSSRVFSR